MDPPSSYTQPSSRPLFQTPQLPPPSQLFASRTSTTLPPLSNLQSGAGRYPPQTYSHPSLSTAASASASASAPGGGQGQGQAGQTLPWSRTSSSRDEQITPPPPSREKREREREEIEDRSNGASGSGSPHDAQPGGGANGGGEHPVKHEGEDGMPSTSDFVKKLYKMLEDTSFADVVSWGPAGDCFVVKDMNEFTKTILPRMFKHSNFASFVRQLNKYDFHKVKNTDDNQFGEHSWTFRHPDFHADRRDALENIKRKVPAARKSTARAGNSPTPPSNTSVDALQAQLERMARQQDEMTAHIRNLESNYQNVLNEMVNFQRNMAQQDGLMQNLIQYFLQLENGKVKAQQQQEGATANGDSSSSNQQPPPRQQQYADQQYADSNPFMQATEAQRMMGMGYAEQQDAVARASLLQMSEISRRAERAGMRFEAGSGQQQQQQQQQQSPSSSSASASTTAAASSPSASAKEPPSTQSQSASARLMAAAASAGLMLDGQRPLSRQDALARIEELSRARPSQAQSPAGVSVSAASSTASPADSVPYDLLGDFTADPYSAGGGSGGGGFSLPLQHQTLGHEGLQVFTVGHLMPKSTMEDENGNWSFDPSLLGMGGLGGLGFATPVPSPPPNPPPSNQGQGQGQGLSLESAVVMPTPQGMGGDPPQEGEEERQQPIVDAEVAAGGGPSAGGGGGGGGGPSGGQTLRVRRSTYVPGWAVPPRVLLVDDDAVSRKLSSKFLQVFGCTIDVAVDGVGAVNKMNLEKYDLVLMDIVMPKLDGVSATSLIRQFDHMTPIISMTSNSKPSEIIKYYSSGMNDILPKPFTKDGLFDMVEKHLMHLKVMQTMARVPRSVGIPPLSDSSFDQALQVSAANMQGAFSPGGGNFNFSLGGDPEDGRINPLAGMGLSDEQYTMILQNLVNGESFMGIGPLDTGSSSGMGSGGFEGNGKRNLDDTSDGRDGKRPRFEVIE